LATAPVLEHEAIEALPEPEPEGPPLPQRVLSGAEFLRE
jgi:hypothetical protein